MNNLTHAIGCIVLAILVLCPPALLTCAFFLHWHDFIKFVLLVVCVLDVVMVACVLGDKG